MLTPSWASALPCAPRGGGLRRWWARQRAGRGSALPGFAEQSDRLFVCLGKVQAWIDCADNDAKNQGFTCLILSRQFCDRNLVLVKGFDVLGDCGCEPGKAAISAEPPLALRVPCIVFRRSKEQVCRVDTRRIVAPMTNKQATRDSTVSNLIREPMCLDLFSVQPECAVSSVKRTTRPNPALTRLINLGPESCYSGFIHLRSTLSLVARGRSGVHSTGAASSCFRRRLVLLFHPEVQPIRQWNERTRQTPAIE